MFLAVYPQKIYKILATNKVPIGMKNIPGKRAPYELHISDKL